MVWLPFKVFPILGLLAIAVEYLNISIYNFLTAHVLTGWECQNDLLHMRKGCIPTLLVEFLNCTSFEPLRRCQQLVLWLFSESSSYIFRFRTGLPDAFSGRGWVDTGWFIILGNFIFPLIRPLYWPYVCAIFISESHFPFLEMIMREFYGYTYIFTIYPHTCASCIYLLFRNTWYSLAYLVPWVLGCFWELFSP